jgi:mannan endo-1,4-beta-mannosidase
MSETVPTSGVRRARRIRPALAPLAGARLPWVERAPGAPYFVLDDGTPWAPVGANESVTWPELAGLLRRRDLAGAEAHLRWLRAHGVTVLRLMLEYAQGQRYYLERPAGAFVPHVVQLWDDLFALCERVGMRILLTPYDTFFHWIRWRHHPYNRRNGGPCADRRILIKFDVFCRSTSVAK